MQYGTKMVIFIQLLASDWLKIDVCFEYDSKREQYKSDKCRLKEQHGNRWGHNALEQYRRPRFVKESSGNGRGRRGRADFRWRICAQTHRARDREQKQYGTYIQNEMKMNKTMRSFISNDSFGGMLMHHHDVARSTENVVRDKRLREWRWHHSEHPGVQTREKTISIPISEGWLREEKSCWNKTIRNKRNASNGARAGSADLTISKHIRDDEVAQGGNTEPSTLLVTNRTIRYLAGVCVCTDVKNNSARRNGEKRTGGWPEISQERGGRLKRGWNRHPNSSSISVATSRHRLY